MSNPKPETTNVFSKAHLSLPALSAVAIVALLAGSVQPALPYNGPMTNSVNADTSDTSLELPAGKAEGSGAWGVVGDIDTALNSSDRTYTYGVAFDPTTGALSFTDSGKVNWSAGTNTGTPSIHTYSADASTDGSSDSSYTDYEANGVFSTDTMAASGSTGSNAGIGQIFDDVTERDDITLPADKYHGPRGITYTSDGTAWIANSEGRVGTSNPVLQMTSPTTLGTSVGYTPLGTEWSKNSVPGNVYYPVGIDTNAAGDKIIVSSEVAESVHWYSPETDSWEIIKMRNNEETGANQPYGVAVDKKTGDLYIPLKRASNDTHTAHLKKLDSNGTHIGSFYDGLSATSTVMFAAVDPTTQEVFSTSQFGTLQQWAADGTHQKAFENADFPGLRYVRGIAFDDNGRVYASTMEGNATTRIMVLGKTPEPLESATVERSVDGQEYTIEITPGDSVNPDSPAYQQTQVLDYIVEAKAPGSDEWFVVESPRSVENVRALDGLEPNTDYEFRVYAVNEAGTGDWTPATLTDATISTTLVDDLFTTEHDTAFTIDVTLNDSIDSTEGFTNWAILADPADPNSATDTLTVDGVGAWTITPEGVVTFTPVEGFYGELDPITIITRSGDHYLTSKLSGEVLPAVVEPTDPPTEPTPTPTDPTPTPTDPAPAPTDPAPTVKPTPAPTDPAPTVKPTPVPAVSPSAGVLGDNVDGKSDSVDSKPTVQNKQQDRLAQSGASGGHIAILAIGLLGAGIYATVITRRRMKLARNK